MNKNKIAFFDIDMTLTSEIDASVPLSTIEAIRKSRANGNLMFINTGRCLENIHDKIMQIGFDGYVCGCGTNIVLADKPCSSYLNMNSENSTEILHIFQTHDITMQLLKAARDADIDIVFESKTESIFDTSRPLHNPEAVYLDKLLRSFHSYKQHPLEIPDFTCDKLCIWYAKPQQLEQFRRTSDMWFDCIERSSTFCELVPTGYSKATGIQFLLDRYGISLEDAYAFGDSMNDIPMLKYVPNSVAMGNSKPESLFKEVSYITDKASCDGISNALKHFNFY